MDCMHNHKIAHRDIKPDNIRIKIENGKGVIKIIDFGISKQITNIQHNTMRVGTYLYQSPEQIRNINEMIDSYPADVWSTAATIFKLLYNKLPWEDGNGRLNNEPEIMKNKYLKYLSFPEG